MAQARAVRRRPAPKAPAPALPPARPLGLWAAGAGGAVLLALLQAQLLGWPVDPGSLRLELLVVAAYAGAWAWLWNLGRAQSVNAWRASAGALSALAWMLAVRGSGSDSRMDASTLGLYGLALSALYLALVGLKPRPEQAEPPQTPWVAWAWLVGGSAALMLGTVAVRAFARGVLRTPAPSDAIFMFFMPRSDAYEGVPGGAAPRFDQWQAVLLYLALALGVIAYLGHALKARLRWMLAALMGLGFAGKLNISYFSPTGLDQVASKIANIGTAYFQLVTRIDNAGGLMGLIMHFNKVQSMLGTHAETHPFGPELLYTGLSRLTAHDPFRTGLIIMVLALFTFVPVVLMAARYFKDPAAGWAAGALYLFTPQQLILSGAGTDCLVTLGLAWVLYLIQRAVDGRSWRWGAAAGLALFATSMISSGVLLPMAFAGLWALWLARRADSGAGWAWLGRLALALSSLAAAFVAAHALLWAATGGSFHYAQVLQDARPVQLDLLRVRPYDVWVWLNPFQIGAYVGWPLVALLLAGLVQGVRRADLGDGLLVASAGFALLVAGASLGNAESQRMFQYMVLLLLLPAVGALRRPGPGGPQVDRLLLAGACVLLFINTVALEATVLDYW